VTGAVELQAGFGDAARYRRGRGLPGCADYCLPAAFM